MHEESHVLILSHVSDHYQFELSYYLHLLILPISLLILSK